MQSIHPASRDHQSIQHILAGAQDFLHDCMCAQRRLWSVSCASTKSIRVFSVHLKMLWSLCYKHRAMGILWSDFMDVQPVIMFSSCTCNLVGNFVAQLILFAKRKRFFLFFQCYSGTSGRLGFLQKSSRCAPWLHPLSYMHVSFGLRLQNS